MKSLAASAALIAAVFGAATAFAADPAAGKKVAQGTCAVCHGLDGIAKNFPTRRISPPRMSNT